MFTHPIIGRQLRTGCEGKGSCKGDKGQLGLGDTWSESVTSHQARAHVITILGARCQMATRMRYKEREVREREEEKTHGSYFLISDPKAPLCPGSGVLP